MALVGEFEAPGLTQPDTIKPEKLAYRDAEVAELLGVCQNTARKLIESGELAHFRIGRRLLVPHDAVVDYMRRKVEEAKSR